MLEINHVNLPRPHENAQVHMRAVFQLRSACCSLPLEVRGERWGVLYLTGCHPKDVRNKRRATQQPKGHPTHPGIGGWLSNRPTPLPPLLLTKAAVKW